MKNSRDKAVPARIEIRLTAREKAIIERYCKREGRTLSDVLREFIRSLEKQR